MLVNEAEVTKNAEYFYPTGLKEIITVPYPAAGNE